MTEPERKPLVLVVDDIEDYREDVIPTRLKELGARCLLAEDIETACRLAETHTGKSTDPINLVVLDMHMPESEERANPELDAGLRVLDAFRGIQLILPTCKVIVFTSYGSYGNCVAAVKAGAHDYISKTRQTDPLGRTSGGIDELAERCRELLADEVEPEAVLEPYDEWLASHHKWLTDVYAGKWVAFVGEDAAQETSLALDAKNGLFILSGETYEEVRRIIVNSPPILRALPPVVFVAETEDEDE